MNGISIVIPYYKDIYINESVNKLIVEYKKLDKREKKLYEIIVINDGSQKIKDFQKNFKIKVFNKKKNEGAAKTRNTGLKIARKKYVLFLDSDVIVADNFLKKLLKIIGEKKKKVFYFTPSFIPANKNPTFFQRYLAACWYIIHTKDFKPKEVISSFCLLVEKNYFLKVGSFSEKFKNAGGEEFELISRIEKKFVKVSNLSCHHYQDNFFMRLKKLFFRSLNYKQVIVNNKNISLKTKFFYAIELLNSFLLILNFIGVYFLNLNLSYFLIFVFVYLFLEKNFFGFLISNKMYALFIVSTIFKLLENLTIASGLMISYIKNIYK